MRPRSLVVAALAIGGVAAVLLWPKGREVDVVAVARGPLAQSVVATGRMRGDVFVAEEVLAKHDETYMPKEVADKMGVAHQKHDVQVPAAGTTP